MQFAIEKLAVVEANLKETIEMLSNNEVDTSGLKHKLEEIQVAILVLYEVQPIINIGQIMSLKSTQKQ